MRITLIHLTVRHVIQSVAVVFTCQLHIEATIKCIRKSFISLDRAFKNLSVSLFIFGARMKTCIEQRNLDIG